MLAMAQVGPGDLVYDLGSGDGRTVIAAVGRGARAVGVEYNQELVEYSQRRARQQGVGERVRFVRGDIFQTDFSEATVVTLYLLPDLNRRLRPTLLAMRPGTRIVSHAFGMDDWEPDETSRAQGRTAHLWIVPARVDGPWQLELDAARRLDLALTQKFQRIEGTIALGQVEAGLREPRLRGREIRFAFVDGEGVSHECTGMVSGERMSGHCQAGSRSDTWSATRRVDAGP